MSDAEQEVIRSLNAQLHEALFRLAAVRALLDHEDTAGHMLTDDPRYQSDGFGVLETWQVRHVLDGAR